MERIRPIARRLGQARWLPIAVIGLTLALLGGMTFLGWRKVRETIGHQIIHRDAEVLREVATLEQIGADSPEALAEQLEDTAGQLALALRLSRLREGVLATRLFSPAGDFVTAVPVLVRETRLTETERAALARHQPLSRYDPAARLSDHFLVAPGSGTRGEGRLPLLSVLIPLQAPGQTNLLGVAELIQDGTGIAIELAALDRHLTRQAALVFAVSGAIAALALGSAFWRMQKITARIEHHAAELRRANQELALVAKTSALGAVTAHVLHGLSSPLTGLQHFMAAHAADDAEWQDALRGTERMQALVGEFVRLLGDQTNGATYMLPLDELAQIVADKTRTAAKAAGVRFDCELTVDGALSNRNANLVLLILENLLQNAVQATPRNKNVRLAINPSDHGAVFEVADQGPGLPNAVRDNLFLPCRSTKPGGNGIGLALSQHLARHLGTDLKLVSSSQTGCVFALVLPRELLAPSVDTARQPARKPVLAPAS